jgi:acetyltransferase-like isoleucine patch superfamily enzyme
VTILGGAWLSVITEHNGVTYEPALTIGDGTTLGHGLLIACVQEVTIGTRVLASDRVFIGDTSHGYVQPDTAVIDQPMTPPRPVRIGDGAFLGVNAVVLPGVTIGARAYVGASAVVTKDVPPGAVVAGNPARVIRRS